MTAGFGGDGLRRPLNAPPGGSPPIGIQPGVSNAIVIANKVIVFGPAGGVFVYVGTPGLGNPPIAWMSSGTTDPYGNALPSTTGVAASGTFRAGNTIITPVGEFAYSGAPALGNLISSSSATGGTDSFGNVWLPGVVSYTPGTTFFAEQSWQASVLFNSAPGAAGPWTQVGSIFCPGGAAGMQFFSSPGGFTFGGGALLSLAGTATSPSVISTDTWHAMTLQNSWANNAGFAVAQYRLVASPPKSVEIIGAIVGTAATSAQFFTLPAGYRPTSAQGMPVGATAAADSTNLRCDTSGNLTIANVALPVAQTFFFHGTISLDA